MEPCKLACRPNQRPCGEGGLSLNNQQDAELDESPKLKTKASMSKTVSKLERKEG